MFFIVFSSVDMASQHNSQFKQKQKGGGWMAGLIKADCTNSIYSSDPTDLFCALFRGSRLGEALSEGKEEEKLLKGIS